MKNRVLIFDKDLFGGKVPLALRGHFITRMRVI